MTTENEKSPAPKQAGGKSRGDALTDRDLSKIDAEQGLYRKFDVRRVDGSDQPGGKHHDCEYFVLDMTHDQHARAALRAYASGCASTHPDLSADLVARYALAPVKQPAAAPSMLDAAEFAKLQTYLTEHHTDVRPSYPAGLASWALAALVFERADSQPAAAPEACAHDYVRSDTVCIECGDNAAPSPADERAAFASSDDPANTGVGSFCQPGDRPEPQWLLMFDDADRGNVIYKSAQEARKAFAHSEGRGWNVWLFSPTARAASASETGAEGAIPSQSDEGRKRIYDIALKYCEFDKQARGYNVLRYECDEDFFNFVFEAAGALARSPAMAAEGAEDDSWIDAEAKHQFAHLRDHDVWKNDGEFIGALVECLAGWGLDMMTDDNTHDLYDLWLAGRAAASSAMAAIPDEATFQRLFIKHGGPVDSEGWCINGSGLRDFLRDLAAAPQPPAQADARKGLTDEQIIDMAAKHGIGPNSGLGFARDLLQGANQ